MLKYLISQKEMKKRKEAIGILFISTMIGLMLASLQHFTEYYKVYIIILPLILIAFLIFGKILFNFINSLSKIRIMLNDEYIQRTTDKTNEKYKIKDIKKINIIKTNHHELREVQIALEDNQNICFNNLDNFNDFLKELKSRLNKEVIIKEIVEPFNMKHPRFYVIFGLVVGFLSLNTINLMNATNRDTAEMFYNLLLIFIFLMGVVFIFYKPISKRSSIKNITADKITGILIILSSILIFLSNQ